jgi:hypothetical protein
LTGGSAKVEATKRYNAAGVPPPAAVAQLPADMIVTVPPEQATRRFSVQQVRVVELLVAGASDAGAAQAVRVHRATVAFFLPRRIRFTGRD